MGCGSGKGYNDYKQQRTQSTTKTITESQRLRVVRNLISIKFRLHNLPAIVEIDSGLENSVIQELQKEVGK